MKPVISLLQFTTVLPLGKVEDLENFGRHSYIYPLAGYIIGLIVALPVFFIADRTVAAAVAIAMLMLITGAHHFDGLLDFGDGLMAHGNREKRVKALLDRNIGAGALALGITITILLFAGLQESPSLIVAIITGEVCAKFSMSFLTTYGTPFREGIHRLSSQILPEVLPSLVFTPLPPTFFPARRTDKDLRISHRDVPLSDSAGCYLQASLWRGKRGCSRCFK